MACLLLNGYATKTKKRRFFMKRYIFALLVTGIAFTLTAMDFPGNMGARPAEACGYGEGGGQGYVPQRRDQGNAYAARPALTQDQARQIIEKHVTSLNPALKVGPMNDAGELYEAEIFSENNEVVQILGVDKRSGRLVLIN